MSAVSATEPSTYGTMLGERDGVEWYKWFAVTASLAADPASLTENGKEPDLAELAVARLS